MSSKNQGKTDWAGQRRPVTRRSGFTSTSQLRFRRSIEETIKAGPNNPITLNFDIPATKSNQWVGWGGYLFAPTGTLIETDFNRGQYFIGDPQNDNWVKFGGLWLEEQSCKAETLSLKITPPSNASIAFHGISSGVVEHSYLVDSRPALLKGMQLYAPEANFYLKEYPAILKSRHSKSPATAEIITKSCNRCGRFLPINNKNELLHLAFTNHCKARRPCMHAGFGRIAEDDNEIEVLQFEYGFQLECRFCKKFEVNGALNPQRTAGQMKEDGARRRHFELLLEYLYEGSPQLRYKNKYGRDLANDIWEKFDRKCFKCGKEVLLEASNVEDSYNLDHTRPLALLWPLDESATCLCKSCNSAKRDRPPSDFYTEKEIKRLSKITNISLKDLKNPQPNIDALKLIDNRREWLINDFLKLPELQKIRDGKRTSDLVLKALNRVIDICPEPKPVKKFRN
jgi:hypothetical protein